MSSSLGGETTPKILHIFDKTPCNRASVFIIQFLDDDADEEQEFEDPAEYEKLSAWFKNDPISKQMKRGDVLHNVSMGDYRNDGKFIFDGEKLCYPYNEPFAETANPDDPDPDEYGYVPRQFLAINEFPVRYWSEIIDHNYYIYADLTDFIDHITWHTIPNTQSYLGIFTTHTSTPKLHAIFSKTKDIPRGVQLYAYDINAFYDLFYDVLDSPTIISQTLAQHDIDPENVIVCGVS
jgi:hypothetical protein